VAYHGEGSVDGLVARGFSAARVTQLVERAGRYGEELLPVKQAAYESGGVAIDSDVFSGAERARLSYFIEAMAPDGGRHAMLVLGLFGGAVASVTMLGRTASAFSARHVRAMQLVSPVLGLAARARAACVPPAPRCLDRPEVEVVAGQLEDAR
jgi:hypothetical protein